MIYVNGDSFASGSEIVDHLLPGWPGYHLTGSHLASDADQNWDKNRITAGIEYFGSYQNFMAEEKRHSWPSQIKKIDPDLEIINNSFPGSSITGILNRTIVDLLRYQTERKIDTVFIQITGPYRFEFYNSDLANKTFIREQSAGWLEKLPNEDEKEIAKRYLKLYKDEDWAIKYLYTMTSLRHAVKNIAGVEPIFLSSMKIWKEHILDPIFKNKKLSRDRNIQILLENSGMLSITDDDTMETVQISNNFLYCPCKHFEIRCHEEFSKIIYNRYLK